MTPFLLTAQRARHISTPLLALLIYSGCTPECEGAACGTYYTRAEIGMFGADRLSTAEVDALTPDAAVEGVDADGYGWSLLPVDGGLLTGVPDVGEVRWSAGYTGTVDATLTSPGANEEFGSAVAQIAESETVWRLAVGAPGHAVGPTQASAGAVYFYDAVEAGPAGDTEPTVTVVGVQAEDHLGAGVWGCGDLDADGAVDWVAAAPWADSGTSELAGAVYLGLSAVPLAPGVQSAAALPVFHGTGEGDRFGAAAACRTSFDTDGVPELLIGAPFKDRGARGDAAGAVYIWRGGADLSTGSAATITLAATEAEAWFGSAVAVGDLDGDGIDDVAIGAPGADRTGSGSSGLSADPAGSEPDDVAGAVYIYAGVDLRAELDNPALTVDPSPVRALHGESSRGRFGASIAIADLNADGVADLVVGAPGTNRTGQDDGTRAGAVTVWFGPSTDWPEVSFASDASSTVVADRQYLEAGRTLAVGDPDGDGQADLLLLLRQLSDEP